MDDLERFRSHELPPDNFGVDFNCNINTLYTRLTEKPGEIICHLSSNWEDISDVRDFFDFERGETYDIFASIKMYLKSDLKIKSTPGFKDRSSKIVSACAFFENAHRPPWESKKAKIIAESAKLGIDLSFVDFEPEYDEGFSKDKFYKESWLVPQNPELKWAIKLVKDSTGYNRIYLEYPFRKALDLEGQQTVQNILRNTSFAIEHVVRVCYAVEGKVLPEKRLVFFPYVERGKEKEVSAFALCSYCGVKYSTSEAKCPSCGARAPQPF